MKAFTTITDKEILYAAYYHTLDLYLKKQDLHDKCHERNAPHHITEYWMNKYHAQLDELHQAILEIERSEKQ